ncbi:cyclin-A3-3-like [Trifolium pratense]|uniref:cyclin-A3-3-like n=1 Tax=Trifolium pratense TaxID=57577 RepID=UPI001E691344|nr:cyclin-A3-3-like [Trifolium pratense]
MNVNKRPSSNYAKTIQKEVTNQMREILVDWLAEVTEEFKFASDALYLTVSCIDRFLSIRPLKRKHLQLLGVSSIFIASIFMGAAGQTDFQHSNQQLEFLACYLLELCLLCLKCVKFLPSIAAASALFLSRFIIQPNHHPWNQVLQCQTGYKPLELQECVLAIHVMHSTITVCPLQAVRQKYLKPKKAGPSIIKLGLEELNEWFVFEGMNSWICSHEDE